MLSPPSPIFAYAARRARTTPSDTWWRRRRRVDGFGARVFPRQWQHRLHGCDSRLMCFLIARALTALRTIRQTCKAPSGLALFGRYWWAFDGYGRRSGAAPAGLGRPLGYLASPFWAKHFARAERAPLLLQYQMPQLHFRPDDDALEYLFDEYATPRK
jgi:hypothetical protein